MRHFSFLAFTALLCLSGMGFAGANEVPMPAQRSALEIQNWAQSTAIPADFPVKVYSSNVTSRLCVQGQAPLLNATQIVINTSDPPERVFAWHKANLQQEGWKVLEEQPLERLGVAKGDDVLMVSVSPRKGSTRILIAHASLRGGRER